jgi:periplasmic protein TonB
MQKPGPSRSRKDSHAENSEFEHFPGAIADDKPLCAALFENIRDAFFPQHLPPLELTSKPIPVPDRMTVRTNPWALGSAAVINGSIAALAILLGMRAAINHFPPTPRSPHIDISPLHIFAPAPARPSNGGSGGGSHDLIDPTDGRNPPFAVTPIAPPMVPLIRQPKLPEESTINIRLPEDNSMPNIGVHNSTVTLVSNGPGGPYGVGTGNNGSYGPGNGPGSGPGDGNSIYVPGNGIVVPKLIYAPEAEFSDDARRNKYQGTCMLSIIVDTQGNPQNVHVIRALGMGLDEKALEAVRRYRFKPGTKDGKAVPVLISVAVDFRLF